MQFYRKSVCFFEKSFRVPKNRLRLIIRAHWRDKTIGSKVSGFLV